LAATLRITKSESQSILSISAQITVKCRGEWWSDKHWYYCSEW